MAIRRIQKELSSVEPIFDVRIYTPYIVHATIPALKDSRYENIKIDCMVQFPLDYPFKPPTISFNPPIFHPNITVTGKLLIPELKDEWNPALTIDKLLHMIWALFDTPMWFLPVSDKGKEEELPDCEYANPYAAEIWGDRELYQSLIN